MHTIREAQQFNDMARQIFTKDGYHVPMVIFFKGKDHFVLPIAELMETNTGKDTLSVMIRNTIKDFGVSGVIMITEAWMHVATNKDDEITRQLIEGEKSVSEVATKLEVLMVQAESDDGLSAIFTNPIERDEEGNPTLGEVQLSNTKMAGRFGSFFM